MHILKLFANFIRWVNQKRGKTQHVVFFDTNCYREIARDLPNRVNTTMHKILVCEAYHSKLGCANYFVLAEMMKHLTDNPPGIDYKECKLGLKAAISHIEGDKGRLLFSADGQILQFFFHPNLPPTFQTVNEESIIDAIKFLDNHQFSDEIVNHNHAQILQTNQYIDDLKQSWIQSTIVNVIRRIDPAFQFTDNFAFMTNPAQRAIELQKLEAAETSGHVYNLLALGMCGYIQNNFNVPLNPTQTHIDDIKVRFRPIFYLQWRIIKKYFSHGYNHNKQRKLNDIIDYLICTSLSAETTFVTNETQNLKRFLNDGGITNVMTLAEYLKSLGLKRLAKKVALPSEVI
jgi:hypothetical protein